MKEYYITANSFASPFFSDQLDDFVKANSPEKALEKFAKNYKHPAGLYAAACYSSADAERKGQKPLARWMCNHELEKQRLTATKESYSYLGNAPGDFELDGKRVVIADPKGGRVVP